MDLSTTNMGTPPKPKPQSAVLSQTWEIEAFRERAFTSPKCEDRTCLKCHMSCAITIAWGNNGAHQITGEMIFLEETEVDVDGQGHLGSVLSVRLNLKRSSDRAPELVAYKLYIYSEDMLTNEDIVKAANVEPTKKSAWSPVIPVYSITIPNVITKRLLRKRKCSVLHGKLVFVVKDTRAVSSTIDLEAAKVTVIDRRKPKGGVHWTNSKRDKNADLRIRIDKKRFYVGREILKGCTRYFDKFQLPPGKQRTRIRGVELTPEAMKLLLDHIYNRGCCKTDLKLYINDIYKLVHFLEFQNMLRMCVTIMLGALTHTSVSEVLVIAFDYPNQRLRDGAYQFFKKHEEQVVLTEEYKTWYEEEQAAFLPSTEPAIQESPANAVVTPTTVVVIDLDTDLPIADTDERASQGNSPRKRGNDTNICILDPRLWKKANIPNRNSETASSSAGRDEENSVAAVAQTKIAPNGTIPAQPVDIPLDPRLRKRMGIPVPRPDVDSSSVKTNGDSYAASQDEPAVKATVDAASTVVYPLDPRLRKRMGILLPPRDVDLSPALRTDQSQAASQQKATSNETVAAESTVVYPLDPRLRKKMNIPLLLSLRDVDSSPAGKNDESMTKSQEKVTQDTIIKTDAVITQVDHLLKKTNTPSCSASAARNDENEPVFEVADSRKATINTDATSIPIDLNPSTKTNAIVPDLETNSNNITDCISSTVAPSSLPAIVDPPSLELETNSTPDEVKVIPEANAVSSPTPKPTSQPAGRGRGVRPMSRLPITFEVKGKPLMTPLQLQRAKVPLWNAQGMKEKNKTLMLPSQILKGPRSAGSRLPSLIRCIRPSAPQPRIPLRTYSRQSAPVSKVSTPNKPIRITVIDSPTKRQEAFSPLTISDSPNQKPIDNLPSRKTLSFSILPALLSPTTKSAPALYSPTLDAHFLFEPLPVPIPVEPTEALQQIPSTPAILREDTLPEVLILDSTTVKPPVTSPNSLKHSPIRDLPIIEPIPAPMRVEPLEVLQHSKPIPVSKSDEALPSNQSNFTTTEKPNQILQEDTSDEGNSSQGPLPVPNPTPVPVPFHSLFSRRPPPVPSSPQPTESPAQESIQAQLQQQIQSATQLEPPVLALQYHQIPPPIQSIFGLPAQEPLPVPPPDYSLLGSQAQKPLPVPYPTQLLVGSQFQDPLPVPPPEQFLVEEQVPLPVPLPQFLVEEQLPLPVPHPSQNQSFIGSKVEEPLPVPPATQLKRLTDSNSVSDTKPDEKPLPRPSPPSTLPYRTRWDGRPLNLELLKPISPPSPPPTPPEVVKRNLALAVLAYKSRPKHNNAVFNDTVMDLKNICDSQKLSMEYDIRHDSHSTIPSERVPPFMWRTTISIENLLKHEGENSKKKTSIANTVDHVFQMILKWL